MSKSEFQAKMNQIPAGGIVGQCAGINPAIYAIPSAQAAETLTIGNFAWLDDDSSESVMSIVAHGTNKPLGLVAHTGTYSNNVLNSSASIQVASNEFVDLIIKGDVYVVSQTKAVRGQKIFAKLSDGSIQTAASDATVTGYVETDFSVCQGGEIGALIVISNWA